MITLLAIALLNLSNPVTCGTSEFAVTHELKFFHNQSDGPNWEKWGIHLGFGKAINTKEVTWRSPDGWMIMESDQVYRTNVVTEWTEFHRAWPDEQTPTRR